ncbi:hypothetical protein IQ22_04444 [Pseudomonas duriflava]|uniref:Uncharacterized protein n=1 Tax=Pseudomonas duriflava TaxID=459528 RepID=A0A562PR08_9PSED|nr:hypothetical protein IQ22_04444 [Pseudomonas duriflava]
MGITIEKRFLEADWVVRLNHMKVAFSTEAQARAYADRLHARLSATHTALIGGYEA